MNFRRRTKNIISNLTIWHIIFWLSNLFLFTFPFFLKYDWQGPGQIEKLYPGLIYLIYLVIIVYINYVILIPIFAAKRKVFQYFIAVTIAVLVVNILFALTYNAVNKIPLDFINAISFSVLEVIYVIVTSFFKLFKDWVDDRGLQLKIKEMEKLKIESELYALRAQLNPHFLFNVLNNIYSHSLMKSDITPSIVLKLSDLMSYILYDCKTDMVLLQREVEFIKNYIDLEKIRSEEDFEVEFNFNDINTIRIPPLLFVPLIENAFKHGIGSQPAHKYISITMEISNKNFCFKLKNSKGVISHSNNHSEKGGIGLENVRKRLELLYPDSHQMIVTDTKDCFDVEILIEDFL